VAKLGTKSFCLSAGFDWKDLKTVGGQLPKVVFKRSKDRESGIKLDIIIPLGIISLPKKNI
jgi:hypothetical protein